MGRHIFCRLPLIAWSSLLLHLAASSLAADAPTVTPLTVNGPPITETISAPGQLKVFSISIYDPDYYTCEIIGGTLPNHEVGIQNTPTGWQPYSLSNQFNPIAPASSQSAIYSTKCSGFLYGNNTNYIVVRALDRQSAGTFSIRVVKGPAMIWLKIDGGTASTPYRKVTVNSSKYSAFYHNNQPIDQCMVSESPAFTDAAWQSYAPVLNFTLSPGTGVKTVYMKYLCGNGVESAIYADTILVNEMKTLTLDAPAISSHLNVSGEIACFPFTVTSQGRYWIETTTLSGGPATASLYSSYLITQDAPASGKPNTRVISRDLSPGSYVIKVKSATPACTFTVRWGYAGSVTSFAINNNSAETTSRLVTLNNTSLGNPTQMMASLSANFSDGIWLPYSTAPVFKLNGYNGAKTVYLKVKFASGAESETKWDAITLNETIPLRPDGEWRTGNIYPSSAIDAYAFTIETAGRYTLETRCGSLKDTMVVLYRQDNMTAPLDQDDDSGEHYASRITATLATGGYVAKVTGHFAEGGTYSIRLKRNP